MIHSHSMRLYGSLPLPAHPRVWAVIDREALAHNYTVLARHIRLSSPHTDIIAVIKADAYGHGIHPALQALTRAGCRSFAVACLEEAQAARAVLDELLPHEETRILILGYTHPEDAAALANGRITLTCLSLEHAKAMSEAATRAGVTLTCHIALDTGMNRIGLSAQRDEDIPKAAEAVAVIHKLSGLTVEGMFSHFATADDDIEKVLCQDGQTLTQYHRFSRVLDLLTRQGLRPSICHICNSAAAVRFAQAMPEMCLDAVRLGINLYGYGVEPPTGLSLRPVMRLKTRVVHLHTLPPGETVGYGGTFSSDTPRLIASLPVGYADGFRRDFGGNQVIVHTQSGDVRAPLAGRICMDQCTLDVTGLPVSVGDEVTLFGEDPQSLEALCTSARTITYEALCLISSRVPRIYI